MIENKDGIKDGDLVIYAGNDEDILRWTGRRVHEVRIAFDDTIEIVDYDIPKLSKDFIKIEHREELLGNCPKCDSEWTSFDSSREMQESVAKCSDCGFSIQKKVPEERIVELWNECKEKVNKVLNRYR